MEENFYPKKCLPSPNSGGFHETKFTKMVRGNRIGGKRDCYGVGVVDACGCCIYSTDVCDDVLFAKLF